MTTYESSRIPLGSSAAGAVGSNSSLVFRATAECTGEECAPDEYTVSISNPSANEVAVDYNQIEFSTPDGAILFGESTNLNRPGANQSAFDNAVFFRSGRGELVRMSIPRDIFFSFATSRTLSIRMGSQTYSLPYDTRGSLRRMLASGNE